jgi:hypothetical protein
MTLFLNTYLVGLVVAVAMALVMVLVEKRFTK